MFDALIDGLVLVLQWKAFSLMMIGMGLGFIVGLLPGIGGAATLAMMLPFIFKMSPAEAFAFLLGMRGSPLRSSLIVKKDSPIKTIGDVKGKRVTGEYPAQLAVWYNVFGSLSNGGLTWNDVKVVPVPAVNEGVDALIQGRADVTTHAIGSAKVKEADAAVGIRYIPLDCSKQGEQRIKKAVPGYYLSVVKAGSSTGIVEDTCSYTYDIYLVGHKALPDAVVRNVLQAIWINIEKLPQFHPGFTEWTKDRAVDAEVTIPYHPAAIRFLKDQNAWPAKMDDAQKKLLALNP